MSIITLTPLNKVAIEAFKKHIQNTSITDRIYMKTIGIYQRLDDDKIIVTIDNFATKFMKNQNPQELRNMIDKNVSSLIFDIKKKFDIDANIDYKLEVKI